MCIPRKVGPLGLLTVLLTGCPSPSMPRGAGARGGRCVHGAVRHRWTVDIPALDASLTVVAQPQGQEIQASGGIYEAAASVTGRYRGEPVTGQAYVEQLGNWR